MVYVHGIWSGCFPPAHTAHRLAPEVHGAEGGEAKGARGSGKVRTHAADEPGR